MRRCDGYFLSSQEDQEVRSNFVFGAGSDHQRKPVAPVTPSSCNGFIACGALLPRNPEGRGGTTQRRGDARGFARDLAGIVTVNRVAQTW